jgi:heme exporter protein D
MENLTDYSNYVLAAYGVASISIISLMTLVVMRYFSTKSKIKNEK